MFQHLLDLRYKEYLSPQSITLWLIFYILWTYAEIAGLYSFLIAFTIYLLIGGWRFQRIVLATIGRDLRGLRGLIQLLFSMRRFKDQNQNVGLLFHKKVLEHPDKACFLYLDQVWTFKQVEDYTNRVANAFVDLGFRAGDDVAIIMESRPEYAAIWLGLSRIGVVPALVNHNLKGPSLLHSISVVNCKAVICSPTFLPAVLDVAPQLNGLSYYFCLGKYEVPPSDNPVKVQSLDTLVDESSPKLPTFHRPKYNDRLYYIYTSGTTGLPKAAIIRHVRFALVSCALRPLVGVKDEDVLYTALPFYHSASGMILVSQCIIHGNTVAIRSKFSASNFWEDCIKYKCTATHYIGELCRYLLTQPEKPSDRQHSIRLMFGNGLRAEVWNDFASRFGIKNIVEFYGSTEGNSNVVNFEGKVGAIGFASKILLSHFPLRLIEVDPVTGEPIRGPDGLCIPSESGEPGEAIGKIMLDDPIHNFDGYVDRKATEKKVVRDVFKKGDLFFRSGDLLTMDEFGYLYFVDRTGDTFRYRGENVSTTEVESVFTSILGLADCVCYGVEVPGVEGRAGMIALEDPEDKVDVNNYIKDLKGALPSYAIPLFLRKKSHLQKTGTYKYQKGDLRKEGFNLDKVHDPLYFLHPSKGCYVTLDAELCDQICSGKIRL